MSTRALGAVKHGLGRELSVFTRVLSKRPLSIKSFDAWAVLGLRPGSTRADIVAAFRELAKVHHPDTGGSAEEFTKIERARTIALEQATN